jgi:predicted CopG family antitoxin
MMNKKNVKINEDAFHALKIYCAENKMKIYEVASELIKEGIGKKKGK